METTIEKSTEIKLENSWKLRLEPEFSKPYMQTLRKFLRTQLAAKKKIYPSSQNIFAAFNTVPFDKVKVVILGQDPYHGPGQAHGLSFSVPPGVPAPPSLQNIFKELESDLKTKRPTSGTLTKWAEQGVLLLNSVLTVEEASAGAHQNRGWETFTDRVIEVLSEEREHLVFVLWGAYAQKKGAKIDRSKHFVIQNVHPSPLSAHRGFFGSKPFSQINNYLRKNGIAEIDWQLG